jgi:hypothetical protein
MSVTLHTDLGDIKIEVFCEGMYACELFLVVCYYDTSSNGCDRYAKSYTSKLYIQPTSCQFDKSSVQSSSISLISVFLSGFSLT